jgi:hypothetical protein
MATPRRKIEPRFGQPITQPTAAPVDTYAPPAPTQGQQLLQALSEINPKLQRAGQAFTEGYIVEKREEGERAARFASEAALKAGDLTRMGELPMQDNPYFMAGYEEEWGRVAAGTWQSDMKAAMDADPTLKESIKMEDFDKFVGGHINQWFKDKGFDRTEFFEKGFGHMKDQYLAMARLGFAEGIEKKLDKNSDEQMFAMVKRSITDNWGNPGLTPDDIARDIDLMVGLAVKRGRPEGKARTAATLAIVAAAREAGAEKGLQMLKLFEKASGEAGVGKLKDQSYGAKALEETRSDLINEAHQEAERDRQQAAREKQERMEEILQGGLQLLQGNAASNLEKYLKDNPDAPPQTVSLLRGLQAEYQDLKYTTNQSVYNELFHRILDKQADEVEVTVEEIVQKGRNRNLRPEDTMRLVDMLQQQKARAKGAKDPLEEKAEPYWKIAYALMENAWKDKIGNFVPRENEFRVRNSRAMLIDRWFALKASGKVEEMSEKDLNQWFLDTGDSIIKAQQSGLQGDLKFQPPTTPKINAPAGAAGETAAAPLPPKAILKTQDFINFRLNKTDDIERLRRQYGIPLERMGEFVKDQARKSQAK